MAIGLVHDQLFQAHDPGSHHCESPQRLVAVERALKAWPGRKKALSLIPLRRAREAELARVHHSSHITRILSTEGRSVSLDPDTSTSPYSVEAALNAVGSLIDLCDAALDNEVENGMALVRPPGHHATPNRSMGFCLFNNVALAAAHLVISRGLERVMVVDWDVHHGNGTEDAFYLTEKLLYFSTHQSPFYPGTGPVKSVGHGQGKGYNINVPMPAGMDDAAYIRTFQDLLAPVTDQYRPQFILVSAGFDAHVEDPLGDMKITNQGYAALSRVLLGLSQEHCPGNLVCTLEGGYHPQAEADAIVACLDAMNGSTWGDELISQLSGSPRPGALASAIDVASNFWDIA